MFIKLIESNVENGKALDEKLIDCLSMCGDVMEALALTLSS